MKKCVLLFSIVFILLAGTVQMVSAQEEPKPKKDTVNIDTDAKPTFYYAVEDEKSTSGSGNIGLIAGIAGGVVILGAAAYFLLKKKK